MPESSKSRLTQFTLESAYRADEELFGRESTVVEALPQGESAGWNKALYIGISAELAEFVKVTTFSIKEIQATYVFISSQWPPTELGLSLRDNWEPDVFSPDILLTDDWVTVRDEALPVDVRIRAIDSLLDSKDVDLAAFLARELSKAELPPKWRNAIICATERVQFVDDELRAQLGRDLLRWALRLRDVSSKASPVLWAAIRRYTSMTDEAGLDALVEFLRPSDPIETRQVVLQALQFFFERAAPALGDSNARLRDRIGELSDKFIDADLCASGENAALILNLVLAAVILGHIRAHDYVARCATLPRFPVAKRAASRLQALESTWAASEQDADSITRVRRARLVLSVREGA